MPARFTVHNPRRPREVADPGVRAAAESLARDTSSATPVRTGRLRSGWRVVRVRDGKYRVVNDVEYARFVEFGTRHQRAEAMLGRTTAGYRSRYTRGR